MGGERVDSRGMCDMAARRSLQSHLWWKGWGMLFLVSHSWDEKILSKYSVEEEMARYACCVCEEAIEDDLRITGLSDIDKDAINSDSKCGVGVVDGCREERVSPFEVYMDK